MFDPYGACPVCRYVVAIRAGHHMKYLPAYNPGWLARVFKVQPKPARLEVRCLMCQYTEYKEIK